MAWYFQVNSISLSLSLKKSVIKIASLGQNMW
jgi:hypothetical protein